MKSIFITLCLLPVTASLAADTVLIAAHRGGYTNEKADKAPENSVANVAVAVAKGFDVYETDIQRTKDGVFVVVHDDTIERETTGQGAVADLTLPDLKALRKRYRDGSVSEEKVATLEELLLAGKGKIKFKADVKTGIIEHMDALSKLINGLGMADDLYLRCSKKEATAIEKHFRNGTPKVELMVKVGTADEVKDIAKRFSPKTIQIDVEKDTALTPEQREAITAAVGLGIIVETHSYSDRARWKELVTAGVRMFHTTQPEETLAWLKEQGWRTE